ncbi:MAG: hypothetical protein Q9157_007087 [Trypethelium eluteriae]
MPFLTVYHHYNFCPSSFGNVNDDRFNFAQTLTTTTCLHLSSTAPSTVKIAFIYCNGEDTDLFIGGRRNRDYMRIEAQIGKGRSEEEKRALMTGLTEAIVQSVKPKKREKLEVQVRIVEEEEGGLMTNGRLGE